MTFYRWSRVSFLEAYRVEGLRVKPLRQVESRAYRGADLASVVYGLGFWVQTYLTLTSEE